MSKSSIKDAIILLSHGSKEKYARKTLVELKNKLKKYFPKSKCNFYHAFLQFNKPTLYQCLNKVKSSKVVIIPVFISHGKHTLSDVPKIIKKVRDGKENVIVKVALPVGSDDLLVKALYKRCKDAIANWT